MDKAKHTPTPWRVGIKETGGFRPKSGERRMEIACLPSAYFDALDIFGPEDNSDDPLPNAEFIVEAVNSHYQMKADLERARKALEEIAKIGDKITDPRNDYGIRMCNIAHAGLTVLAH